MSRVAIVGAGPVGMFLALDLASRGVRSLLVERSGDQRTYPKGNTHNARTMEHYRRLGLSDAVRAVGLPPDHPTDVAFLTSLDGFELQRLRMPSSSAKLAEAAVHSAADQVPEPLHRSNQMYVEQLLYRHVQDHALVSCRYATELVAFEDAGDGVTITLRPTDGGPTETVAVEYLVGCDGPRSEIRRRLGFSYGGENPGELGFMSGMTRSTYVRIPGLAERMADRRAWQYWLLRHGAVSNLITLDGGDEYLFHAVQGDASDDDAVRALIDECVGTHVETEILDSQEWIAGRALVADHYQRGRVTLCGDAVHLFTPTGGFGMNTGIDDAANLAWKLAAAVHGWAGSQLLDSYEPERRPIGVRNTRAALGLAHNIRGLPLGPTLEADTDAGRQARAQAAEILGGFREEFASLGIQLGAIYDGSPIVWPDGTPAAEDPPDVYVATSRPGSRAPHLWLSRTRSLFDELGAGFVLLHHRGRGAGHGSLAAVAARRGIPLTVRELIGPEARELYPHELTLVRPDGHVAWRGDELPAADRLLGRVTGVPDRNSTQSGFHR